MSDFFNIGTPGGGSEITKVGKHSFPDPWCDIASTQAPKDLRNVLDWSEFMWLTNGTYRMACERVVSYFITTINIDNTNDEISSKYKDYFTDRIKYVDTLRILGNDFQCYGNSFSSIFFPFDRFLTCRQCGMERPIEKVDFNFTGDFEFKATCPSCSWIGSFKRKDRKSPSIDKLRVIRWRPQDIKLQYNPFTHDTEYRLKLDEETSNLIKKGNEFLLRTTPWEIVETVKKDKLFKFAPDSIFHMREDTIAGVKSKGWGIPRFISNFKQAYYIQVIKRFNEALALDYIVPFRVITPQPGSSKVADPLLHQDLSMNKKAVTGMIAEHRKDPASWHYLPFPMEYQTLGGEGMQMGTYELINAATDEMLNAQGIPAELYRGSLSIQAAPMALRLFQQTWPHLVSNYNDWLTWAGHKIAKFENWEPANINLQPVTLADDIEKKQVLLQLASANIVSKRTALSPFNVDIDEETDRLYDEQKQQMEKEREFQVEQAEKAELEQQLQMAQQPMMPGAGGGMPGGMPGAGGGMPGGMPGGGMGAPSNGSVTPQGMMAQADQIAQQLVLIPYENRRSQLRDLKSSDPALHALVTQRMEDIRSEADSAGGQMLLDQQGQAGQMI